MACSFMGLEGRADVGLDLEMRKMEDDSFIAYSPEFKIHGTGKTEEAAIEDFNDSYNIFLKVYNTQNKLKNRLEYLGWDGEIPPTIEDPFLLDSYNKRIVLTIPTFD